MWHLVTRLGELQILLPAALLASLALMWRRDGRPMAVSWLGLLCAAILLTTASKVAFIGWGVGWAEVNYTGISGHAMIASAVYPLLLGALTSNAPRRGQLLAVTAGCALALLVGISRVVLRAHSGSEVLAGLLVGGSVSAAVPLLAHVPRVVIGPVIPVVLALWLAVMPASAPASRTHSMVTQLALRLSGHQVPYTRDDMLRELRRRRADGNNGSSVPPFALHQNVVVSQSR